MDLIRENDRLNRIGPPNEIVRAFVEAEDSVGTDAAKHDRTRIRRLRETALTRNFGSLMELALRYHRIGLHW